MTRIPPGLLTVCLFLFPAAASLRLDAQSVSLELIPSQNSLSGCADEELALLLRLVNPQGIEISGYQVFLRFPAEQFAAAAYQDLLRKDSTFVQAPPPFGVGFRPCTSVLQDAWDDGAGSDVVAVVSSFVEGVPAGQAAVPFTALEADLGRFVFRTTGTPSGGAGVLFENNDGACHLPLSQTTKVFSRRGEPISLERFDGVAIVVSETDPQLRFFDSVGLGAAVELSWGYPQATGIAGVRLYRAGELLANLIPAGETSFLDETPLVGEVVYEAAILFQGRLDDEGCRRSSSPAFRFIRGDATGDGRINLTDSVEILGHLFQPDVRLECEDVGDVNDNGVVNLSDAVAILEYLFEPDGAEPPPPFPDPGVDPTPDDLRCD